MTLARKGAKYFSVLALRRDVGVLRYCGAKVYQRALYIEIKKARLPIEREYKIVIKWGKSIIGYHVVDFLIGDELVIEIKATAETQEFHKYQLLSYLKAADKRLGVLLNFGSGTLGIKRVVNKL